MNLAKNQSAIGPLRLAIVGCWLLLTCGLTTTSTSGPVIAQEPATVANDALDEAGMAAELARLDEVCQRLNLDAERRVMQDWMPLEPTDAHLLYLPVEFDPLASGGQPVAARAEGHAQWLKHFTAARQRHARYCVAQAERSAMAGDEWTAYRQLWRAVREDPNNPEAKRVLSPLLLAMNVRARPRVSRTAESLLAWPAGSFSVLDTANFKIVSRADAGATVAIAEQLEKFYALWTQVFYPLWARPNVTKDRLAGRGSIWGARHEFRIVVCKDRREYLDALGVVESNIDASVGYYSSGSRAAFFYPDQHLELTLFHELTHQLLAEGSQLRAPQAARYERDFWLVEGIALYMESLVDCGNHWSVGGWTSPRLQSARYRGLHDGYWVDWPEFTSGSMEKWKADPDISKLYTQAAGLTHFFLDGGASRADDASPQTAQDRGSETHARSQPGSKPPGASVSEDSEASRAAYYAALMSATSGDPVDGRLLELLGSADAQRNYVQFLLVRDQQVEAAAQHDSELPWPTELVLTRSQLDADSWHRVRNFTALKWLDVSFSNAKSEHLAWLEHLTQLERLSLEGTAIDGSTIELISRLPHLKELDLSQCAIDDAALAPLARARALETLWLSGTKISGASAALIESLPKLSFVALDQTAMPSADAQQLSERVQARSRK